MIVLVCLVAIAAVYCAADTYYRVSRGSDTNRRLTRGESSL